MSVSRRTVIAGAAALGSSLALPQIASAAPSENVPPVASTRSRAGRLSQKHRWRRVFTEEFDGTTLDSEVWTPHRGTEPWTYGHPYNAALDAYSFDPSRVSVRRGVLNLAWDPTPSTVQNNDGTSTTYPYTAGLVHSGKGFWFTEGFLEARIRFDERPGLWPAFWLLPTPVDQDWPPEIDIAEMIPDDTPDGLYHPHFNYHWKDASGGFHQSGWKWYGREGRSYAGGWHTYGLLREDNLLQVYVDGEPGPSFEDPAVTTQPMYVVLSTGVRKGYAPEAGVMQVDHVRAWQR